MAVSALKIRTPTDLDMPFGRGLVVIGPGGLWSMSFLAATILTARILEDSHSLRSGEKVATRHISQAHLRHTDRAVLCSFRSPAAFQRSGSPFAPAIRVAGYLTPFVLFKVFQGLHVYVAAHRLWERGANSWRCCAEPRFRRFGLDIHPASKIGSALVCWTMLRAS